VSTLADADTTQSKQPGVLQRNGTCDTSSSIGAKHYCTLQLSNVALVNGICDISSACDLRLNARTPRVVLLVSMMITADANCCLSPCDAKNNPDTPLCESLALHYFFGKRETKLRLRCSKHTTRALQGIVFFPSCKLHVNRHLFTLREDFISLCQRVRPRPACRLISRHVDSLHGCIAKQCCRHARVVHSLSWGKNHTGTVARSAGAGTAAGSGATAGTEVASAGPSPSACLKRAGRGVVPRGSRSMSSLNLSRQRGRMWVARLLGHHWSWMAASTP